MNAYLELNCMKSSILIQKSGTEIIDSIPPKYKKIKLECKIRIDDEVDLKNTLESLRYHMVQDLPYEVFDFVYKHREWQGDNNDDNDEMLEDFDWDSYEDFYGEQLKLLCESVENPMSDAVSFGYIELVKYLYSIGCKFTFGNSDVQNSAYVYTVNHFQLAAQNGQCDILKFIFDKTDKYDYSVCPNAVDGGHYDCLKYIIDLQKKYPCRNYIGTAWYDLHNRVDCVQHYSCRSAIKNNNLKMLKFLIDNGFEMLNDYQLFKESVMRNSVDILKYIHGMKSQFEIKIDLFDTAIRNESYECLEYMFTKFSVESYDATKYLEHVVETSQQYMFSKLVGEPGQFICPENLQLLIFKQDSSLMLEHLIKNGYEFGKKHIEQMNDAKAFLCLACLKKIDL